MLTVPVSTASAEKSFSELKLIKTYMRSTMSQERLSALSVLSIEAEIAASVSYDIILKKCSEAKTEKQTVTESNVYIDWIAPEDINTNNFRKGIGKVIENKLKSQKNWYTCLISCKAPTTTQKHDVTRIRLMSEVD
ncbi:hypothetical protein TNCV_3871981 [Trichonephila clavipes]|nr:hypothetical protein TNCV_3871981 [Trichonephila clavipes]